MIDLEKRAKAWDEFSGEAREFTIGDTFNSAYELGVRDGAASVDRRAIVKEAFEKGRASVVFNPHSHYRDKLREMICEGDFDFTNIFEEIEYEGETYADISNEGADALVDYFIDLMEQIDERRSEDVVTVNICDTCEEPYQVNANFDRHDCGKAGAASVPRWTRVEDGLPERRPNVAYSCVRCLVTRKGFVSILCFNHEHEVWDDEECDDYECEIYEVEAWMPLPQPYHGGRR